MRRFLLRSSFVILLSLVLVAPMAAKPRTFAQLVDAYFDDYFKANPSQATNAGLHKYDSQLEDFSLAAHQKNRRLLLEYLAAFQKINPRTLSQLDRDDREIMITTIHSALLEEDRLQAWRKNPDNYSSAVTSSIFSLIKRNFAPSDERLRSVIAREKQIPRALMQARAVLLNPPKIYTDIAIEQMPGNIDFFETTAPDALKEVKDAMLLAAFKQSNDAAIVALKSYQSWLQKDLLPRSHGAFAIGSENYRLKLLYDEMVNVPLPQLLKIGYAQLRKDQKAFVDTARRIDSSKKPEDVLKDVEKDHPSADKLLSSAQQQLDGLRRACRKDAGVLEKERPLLREEDGEALVGGNLRRVRFNLREVRPDRAGPLDKENHCRRVADHVRVDLGRHRMRQLR